jgi:Mg-chelatase subunit ChlD
MRRVVVGLALVASFLTLSPRAARAGSLEGEKLVPTVKKPKVEIVFALDTTGSMGGLIEGAKRKIWSIANEVQKAQQKPEVRIGLVAYRDRGDEYVTQVTPLTTDLDKVYGVLTALQAGGGGDGPEDVNAALDAALTQQPWSDDKDTLKMVFLVGDAPPHMDYENQTQWPQTAKAAVRKNIYINTVQCGVDASTTTTWKDIAHAAEGRYAAIPQDGGTAVAIATPYDDEIRRLGAELDGTYLEYGARRFRDEKKAARAAASEIATKAAPAPVAADRAAFKAKAGASKDSDLVALASASGGAGRALASVEEEALPDELRGKSAAEQQKILEGLAQKRETISKKIAELSKKRDQHIDSERKKAGTKGDSFDAEVVEALHAQAADVGLTY